MTKEEYNLFVVDKNIKGKKAIVFSLPMQIDKCNWGYSNISGKQNQDSKIMIYNIDEILSQTELLMTEYSIPTRDTWEGLDGKNWDDYYANGNAYKSKRHYNIIIKEDGCADTKYERGYSIPTFNCSAYNICTIRIPRRFEGIMHPIIHETVHFLQVNRQEVDLQYIDYNGSNLYEYINQRPELEAHFIQLKYIERFELESLNHEKEVKEKFKTAIKQVSEFNENAIHIIMYSKSLGIIQKCLPLTRYNKAFGVLEYWRLSRAIKHRQIFDFALKMKR